MRRIERFLLAMFLTVMGTAGMVFLRYTRELDRARDAAGQGGLIANTVAGPIEYAEKGAGIPLLSIRLLSPGSDPDAIPPKRTYRRTKYFARNELARMALDVMRKTTGPLAAKEIALAIMRAKSMALGDDASHVAMGRDGTGGWKGRIGRTWHSFRCGLGSNRKRALVGPDATPLRA